MKRPGPPGLFFLDDFFFVVFDSIRPFVHLVVEVPAESPPASTSNCQETYGGTLRLPAGKKSMVPTMQKLCNV